MKHQTEWEKKYDELMTFHSSIDGDIFPSYPGYPAIKNFIATLIAEERKRIAGILIDLPVEISSLDGKRVLRLDEALLAITVQE